MEHASKLPLGGAKITPFSGLRQEHLILVIFLQLGATGSSPSTRIYEGTHQVQRVVTAENLPGFGFWLRRAGR
jgi:hypothetical protein